LEAAGWGGQMNHIVVGPGGQVYGFSESTWWATVSWSA
jgi:hypothetical protein